ncbi:Uncharacterized protein yibN [Candidatus Westeberhardia cardiocondylae]|uniref:Uncharacterized protein yibN n=1 Tax=Candidatus Westeberhardia cardiocondylae TaxID=1594731 RepID=A0A0H5C5U8_9ENTR|nr:rhodanese-like domain-containing protein [Candidatus Westeberhardia cardiocondylae]CEN32336.1 Uncharacterized protein yibN [Candidatus Westeberhardia cardiocondylae]
MQRITQFFMNHFILSMIWLVLFFLLIFLFIWNFFSKVEEIFHTDVINLINRENAVIVDLRSRSEYKRGHIINSINFLPEEIKSKKFNTLYVIRNQPIVLVCSNGFSSRSFAENLISHDFKRVYVLKEGIFGWKEKKFPLVSNI